MIKIRLSAFCNFTATAPYRIVTALVVIVGAFGLMTPVRGHDDPGSQRQKRSILPDLAPGADLSSFGGLTRHAPLSLTVPAPQAPDFSFSINPSSVVIMRGRMPATPLIRITRTGGFTGAVSFNTGTTPLPAGVSVGFSFPSLPIPGGESTTLMVILVSSLATPGTFTLNVNGTGGGLVRTTPVTVTVIPALDEPISFSLSANPSSVALNQGTSATSTIMIAQTGDTIQRVAFSASGLPNGVTASFNPASTLTFRGSSTVTFIASYTAALGTTPVTITGTGISLRLTTTISLTVNGSGTGGVTVTPVINANTPWFNEQAIQLSNSAEITALSITIVVQRTRGLSFHGQYHTVGRLVQQASSSDAGAVIYQFTLAAGETLPPGRSPTFAAQTRGSGTIHPMSGDTYTISYTTGGVSFTQTGHF